ncbi:hypothetical protein [Streptomyces sp. CBMA29]|uniref:hypothetical protein n=1 Tax=Streptomyces sp. CBMA29 TaxID=1896314 RepID=UPI001661D587|nr:hypothetical protein [Streptomyces sp. CBMA29]
MGVDRRNVRALRGGRTGSGRASPHLAAHRGELLAEEATGVAEVSVTGPLDQLAHELADVVSPADWRPGNADSPVPAGQVNLYALLARVS